MKLLNAAHLLPLLPLCCNPPWSMAVLSLTTGKAAICAMFLLNLSFSMLTNASFVFIAPGRLFKLLGLIFASPTTFVSFESLAVSGNASAKDSRLVTSFFDGRLRFLTGAFDFSMREIKAECLIIRLSFLVELNSPSLLRSLERTLVEAKLWVPVRDLVEGRLDMIGAWLC